MKKVFVLLGALAMLAACGKNVVTDQPVIPEVPEVPEVPTETTPGFKVSIAINRADAFGTDAGTRASVKKNWADGDVVFVFFKGVEAPKYLEIKYSSAEQEWTATPMNGLESIDLFDAAEQKMTGVYMPYGSNATVADENGNFTFEGTPYKGVFLLAEQVDYTFDGELKGILDMTAPAPGDAEKYVHFDVSGYDASHVYTLYQDYVKPVVLTGITADGVATIHKGKPGKPIPGYVDAANGFVSFSGVLDASAVGQAVDYQFSVNDETASVLYTRDAGTKTLSASKYIGIGNLSSAWNAMGYVDIGVKVDGKPLYWATKNLGATAERGEASWGNYYAWAQTTGYPVTGTFPDYSSAHNFSTVPTYECYGDTYAVPQSYYFLPGYDPAHAVLGGIWRTPSPREFQKLKEATDRYYDVGFGPLEHEYMDMGDGLGWATYNLGAASENEYGTLYAWGETQPKERYTSYYYSGDHSLDPATSLWGAPWRTPTAEELENLFDSSNSYYSELTWTTDYNGVSGFNGWVLKYYIDYDHRPSLIFPAAGQGDEGYYYDNGYHYYGNDDPHYRGSWGRYWTSTPQIDDNTRHYMLMYAPERVVLPTTSYPDYYGFSIRPVFDLGSANTGVMLTGTKSGYTDKTIFLPAAGYIDGTNPKDQGYAATYWTCERYPDQYALTQAMRVRITNDPGYRGFDSGSAENMRCGLPVRPVFSLEEDEPLTVGTSIIYNSYNEEKKW